MKKILSVIMVCIILMSLFVLPAVYADDGTEGKITETKFDPASSETPQGRKTQIYIIAVIFIISILILIVIIIKNLKDSK